MGLLDLIRGTTNLPPKEPPTAINAIDPVSSNQTVAKIAVAQTTAAGIELPSQLPSTLVPNSLLIDADRFCWPHSCAMNSAEIDLFQSRLDVLCAKGLDDQMAEALADQLLSRDRDMVDMKVCYECRHLKGFSRLRCDNWKTAGISLTSDGAFISRDFAVLLQRCDGFAV